MSRNDMDSLKNDNSSMIEACSLGNISLVKSILKKKAKQDFPASKQDPETGISPLMAAAKGGHLQVCEILLQEGAPWNALDRNGMCAGNYATDFEHWDIVNLLVDAGTKSELILGKVAREAMTDKIKHENLQSTEGNSPVEHEPCTKPDYLERNVRYNESKTALLDDDDDAVMMEWERPLMDAHASIITSNSQEGKTVLNVGFGMGIIDTALQKLKPKLHVIIEAHPLVHKKMLEDGWNEKENVRICFGKWQDIMPNLIKEGLSFDGIFYDTYGEHFTDLEDFQLSVSKTLQKPDGIYSFFNGLAPDNLFFHGVACQCVKLQLAHLGLESEFAPCEIRVNENEWVGCRRKYWHGRETYYLPIVTWNKQFLHINKRQRDDNTSDEAVTPSAKKLNS